jgi:hypothetical protein
MQYIIVHRRKWTEEDILYILIVDTYLYGKEYCMVIYSFDFTHIQNRFIFNVETRAQPCLYFLEWFE